MKHGKRVAGRGVQILGGLFVLGGIFATAISQPGVADPADADIRSAIDRLYELESTCGATGQAMIDAPDATSFGVNAPRVILKSATGADGREEALCESGGRVEFGPETAGVRFLTDDVALAHGVSTYREIDGSGTVLLDGRFNFTHVFQKMEDKWRIQHTHVAPLFPEN